MACCVPRGVGKHDGGQAELKDATTGLENGWRRPTTRRRSRQRMVKKWLVASGLLSENGGSRRCSTQQRFSGIEGWRAEAIVDGSGGGRT
jgi:hypothetical protein